MGLVQTVLGTFGSKRISSYSFFVEKVNWNSKIVIQMVLFGKTWILKMMKNSLSNNFRHGDAFSRISIGFIRVTNASMKWFLELSLKN